MMSLFYLLIGGTWIIFVALAIGVIALLWLIRKKSVNGEIGDYLKVKKLSWLPIITKKDVLNWIILWVVIVVIIIVLAGIYYWLGAIQVATIVTVAYAVASKIKDWKWFFLLVFLLFVGGCIVAGVLVWKYLDYYL